MTFKQLLLTTATAVAATFAFNTEANAQLKREHEKLNPTVRVKRDTSYIDAKNRKISEHYEYGYDKNKTPVDNVKSTAPSQPKKATPDQLKAYNDRWAKIKRDEQLTDEQLRARQKEEDLNLRRKLGLMKDKDAESTYEYEAEKAVLIREIYKTDTVTLEKPVYITDSVFTNDTVLVEAKRNTPWKTYLGPYHEQNVTPGDFVFPQTGRTGVHVGVTTPTLSKKGIGSFVRGNAFAVLFAGQEGKVLYNIITQDFEEKYLDGSAKNALGPVGFAQAEVMLGKDVQVGRGRFGGSVAPGVRVNFGDRTVKLNDPLNEYRGPELTMYDKMVATFRANANCELLLGKKKQVAKGKGLFIGVAAGMTFTSQKQTSQALPDGATDPRLLKLDGANRFFEARAYLGLGF